MLVVAGTDLKAYLSTFGVLSGLQEIGVGDVILVAGEDCA